MTRESQSTSSQREIRVLVTDRPLLAVLRKQPTGMGGLGRGIFGLEQQQRFLACSSSPLLYLSPSSFSGHGE